jgi:uncharacterized protein (TIGR03083 family)
MATVGFDYVEVILEHSAGFAAAANDNLTARVEHCPDWNVADLVAHLTGVHWFWATIVEERLKEPPEESRKPERARDDRLIATFEAGAELLASVLRKTPYHDLVWTWAPAQQDVAFIARHQVQEAAVHHWDAANAAGQTISIGAEVAADAVEEFLTFSVYSDDDPPSTPQPSLNGRFALRCTDIDATWTITDGNGPGTASFAAGNPDAAPEITAPAGDLLLWLYDRLDVDTSAVDSDLLVRFREL